MNLIKTTSTVILAASMAMSCQNKNQESKQLRMKTYEKGSFGHDLNFLNSRDSVLVLKNENAQVIVSAKYQGKVFTSTADGLEGISFGWVNYEAFDKPQDPHMNAYGGENRFWFGPEGSRFSVFFEPGSDMIFDNWVTPSSIDTEPWEINSATEKLVSLGKETMLENYAGTRFHIQINRDISIMGKSEIEKMLDVALNEQVKWVGYKTNNEIVNTGDNAWTRETGAPCIWILDMFTPSPSTVVVIPYEQNASGKIATTDYFGEIPEDRIKMEGGILYFKADGLSRGKLGIPPHRAKPVAGSYDNTNGILTVTYFDIDRNATYLNQEWTTDKDPYSGDAVNAYNDGPLEDGSQMGPFYEIESVSPAAFLKPGEKLSHKHNVVHITGNKEALDSLTQRIFNVSIEEIMSAFDN